MKNAGGAELVVDTQWLVGRPVLSDCPRVTGVSVCPDHDLRPEQKRSQHHHPVGGRGLGLRDRGGRRCCSECSSPNTKLMNRCTETVKPVVPCCFPGFKGSQGPGLGLHGTEPSSTSLLRLSDVYGELEV